MAESSRSTGLRMRAPMGTCGAAGTRRRQGALLGKEHGRRERASIPTRSSRDVAGIEERWGSMDLEVSVMAGWSEGDLGGSRGGIWWGVRRRVKGQSP